MAEHVHSHEHSHDHSHAKQDPCATPSTVAAPSASTSEWPVSFTAKAIEMVKAAMEREELGDHSLRVQVRGGGCAGFMYGLDFDKEPNADDVVFVADGVKVCIDPISADYLVGTTVDYVSGLHGSGFKFNNPTAVRTCGCGSSFSG